MFRQARHGRDGIRFQQLTNKFLQFITDTLTRYEDNHLPIEKLDIRGETQSKELVYKMNRWVRMALRCGGLQELRVSGWPEQAKKVDYYPAMFLGNGGVSKFCESFACLELCYLNIHLESLLNIIHGCPLIEKIVLNCCIGFNELSLQNLTRLKEFEFAEEYGWRVTLNIINTPSLLSFSYSNKHLERVGGIYGYRNDRLFPYGVDASAVKKLKHLYFDGVGIEGLSAIISSLPSLEHLKLHCCRYTRTLRFVCPNLKYVTVENCFIRVIHFVAPKLIQYIFIGGECPTSSFCEIEPIQITTVPDNPQLKGPFTQTYLFQDFPMEV